MKSGRRNSFLLCFGLPEKYDDEKEEVRSTGSSSSRRSDVSEEDSRMIDSPRRRLAKIIRSTMFAKSLLKKSRAGKLPGDPRCTLQRKISDASDEKSTPIASQKSNCEEDSNSDTNLSPPASNSPSPATSPRRRKRSVPPTQKTPSTGPTIYSTATGLCLLILSLSIMLFCGRLFAILWTSTCLCLLPRRVSSLSLATGEAAARKEETPIARLRVFEVCNDKKKVILEGFLERNRRF